MKSIKDLLNNSTSDKQSGHRYGFLYDLLFSKVYQEKQKPLNVLEIGCSYYGPGSLQAYCESDIVNMVVGIDIMEYKGEMNDCLAFHKADAYQEETIKMLKKDYEPFDIIIDDGSHETNDQLFFLNEYLTILSNHGFLICEDITSLNVINQQCKLDEVFFFDGWGNLELNSQSFQDPKNYRHNERVIIKSKKKITDYAKHNNKPHIERLEVSSFQGYEGESNELAVCIPLYHPGSESYDPKKFQDVHCKGAAWAALSMLRNTDLGDNNVPFYFHIEDKVWEDALPVLKEFQVPESSLRKIKVPDPTIKLLDTDKPLYGKSLIPLLDHHLDVDVTMILDSDLFACTSGERLKLYDKLTSPILKKKPSMTYFYKKDITYWWWVSVCMGATAIPLHILQSKTLGEVEQIAHGRLGFEKKEVETCGKYDKVPRYFCDEYIKTFPREHPARDLGVSLIPQCYTLCYAFAIWAEYNEPFVELDRLLGVPTYDWEKDYVAEERGRDCFAHIRVERGRSEKFTMPSIIHQYWDKFLSDITRHVKGGE